VVAYDSGTCERRKRKRKKGYPKESKEALNLMKKWTPITFEDTLYLLSSNFCCNEHFNKNERINYDKT
jgi:hypothetical protein